LSSLLQGIDGRTRGLEHTIGPHGDDRGIVLQPRLEGSGYG
jgi:hypothetical protein